jgi:hypothetical protein
MSEMNFYVRAGGAADNGGSGDTDSHKETYANVTATSIGSGVTDLDNNNGGAGWGTTADGDWICHDTAGTKELLLVTDITQGGGDADVIRVVTISETPITTTTGVSVKVGGAFDTVTLGNDSLEDYLAGIGSGGGFDGEIRWLNIEADQTYILSATLAVASSGSIKRPRGMRAAGTGWTNKPILSYAGEVCAKAAQFVVLRDLHLIRTANGGSALDMQAGSYTLVHRCILEATDGTSEVVDNVREDMIFWDCEIKNSGTATGALVDGAISGWWDNCIFSGGNGSDFTVASGIFTRCKFVDCEYTAGRDMTGMSGCLFEAGTTRNGLKIDVSAADMVCVRNSIFQDAPDGSYYGAYADEANYSMFHGHNNLWYNNGTGGTLHRGNIDNYEGTDDVEDEDPNLDTNDIPNSATGPTVGAGDVTNKDIGRRQHTDAVGAVGAALSRVRIGM